MSKKPNIPESARHQDIADFLQSEEYLRERWEPRHGDEHYLLLSDLRLALEPYQTAEKLKVLDYGCGCSPYRPFFANSDYRRADYIDTADLDYKIVSNQPLAEADATFDLILSTQVFEHVDNPAFYLRECYRLLKPGGRLILSTHGSYRDHGCPYDFQRWTADGLDRDLRLAGFEVRSIKKHTTDARAVVFYVETFIDYMNAPKSSFFGFIIAVLRKLIGKYRRGLHAAADRYFSANRLADGSDRTHNIYLGLIAVAQKPANAIK